MNIFETLEKTTTRIEPFHSQFLADALQDSIGSDRSLFNAVWRLTAPEEWDAPENPQITAEENVPGQGRIDLAIKGDSPQPRIVGIEVKTTDASVTPGQLERYRNGLAGKFPQHAIAIAYLTPFNRERAKGKADDLATVREFDDFQRKCPDARHISWLDIAAIPGNGNQLWRQHQRYVRLRISSLRKLRRSAARGRAAANGEAVGDLWDDLSKSGIKVPAWRLRHQHGYGPGSSEI